MVHELPKPSAEHPPETTEEEVKEKDATQEKTVKKNVEDTRGKIKKTVPDVKDEAKQPGAEDTFEKKSEWSPWKPMPRPPSAESLGKAALIGLTIATPPLGVTAAAGVWGWNKLKKFPPVRWIDHGARAGMSVAKEGIRNVWEVGTYPVRVAGTLTGNILRRTKDVGYSVLDRTFLELYRDFRKAVNHKFNFPKDTNPLAAALTAAKGLFVGALHLPGYLVKTYGSAFSKHPIATVLGTGLAIGAFYAHGGILATSGKLFEALLHFLEAIASKIGAP